MNRIESAEQMHAWVRQERAAGARIGFVPTMGALHEGHLSLVRLARDQADRVVVSIFVNPAQFGPEEDQASYPRDLEGDLSALEEEGVDAVFLPSESQMYAEGHSTWVVETRISAVLEGASRPGHFRGVTTVVAKLLAITSPDLLVLGQKDAQQVAVLTRMISDLHLAVEVMVGPTLREPDGLALSSRNAYLSDVERRQAPALHHALLLGQELVREGERDPETVLDRMRAHIEAQPAARSDYVAAVDPQSFESLEDLQGADVLLCVAAHVGQTRLIDNIRVSKE